MYPHIQIVLPSYGVLAFLGGFITLIYLYFRSEKYGIAFHDFLKLFLLAIIGVIAGSKILFAITHIPWLIKNFSIRNLYMLIPESGFVFYGGLFGVLIVIRLYTYKHTQYDIKTIYTMAAPAIPLFHSFGRIGCLLAGCCYGKKLPQPVVLFDVIQFNRIPTQLFECIFEFVLFCILHFVGRKNDKADLMKMYLMSYAIFRFGIEFLRGDEVRGIYMGISTSQLVSMGIIVYYLIKKIRCLNKEKNRHI